MTAFAIGVGYLIGSVPSAEWLGRLWGVDLWMAGSANPGANNALRTSGPSLAAVVLLVEAGKGLLAVLTGDWIASEAGMIAAGLGAIAGNVYNVWYRFAGGKGLGISLGVLVGSWPTVLPAVLFLIVVAAVLARSAGIAALVAIGGLLVMSPFWAVTGLPTGGLDPGPLLVILAVGMTLLLTYKHWRDSPLNARWRPRPRGSVSPGHH